MNEGVFGKEGDDFSGNLNTATLVILDRFKRGIFDGRFFYGLAILRDSGFILLSFVLCLINFGDIFFQRVIKIIPILVSFIVLNKIKILKRYTNSIKPPFLINHINDIDLLLLIILFSIRMILGLVWE